MRDLGQRRLTPAAVLLFHRLPVLYLDLAVVRVQIAPGANDDIRAVTLLEPRQFLTLAVLEVLGHGHR